MAGLILPLFAPGCLILFLYIIMTLSFSHISEAKHKTFVKQLNALIDALNKESKSEEICLDEMMCLEIQFKYLDQIFKDYGKRAAELKQLVKLYNQTQQKARVLLRQQTVKHLKNKTAV